METKDELIEKLKEAANLLSSAKCPDCDGGGVIVREIVKTGTRWVDDGEGNPLPEPYPIQDYEPSQCFWCYHKDNLLSEIVVIEKQIEKQEEKPEKPFYDEDYLQECITKAKTNLSKIVDVDKELDEIRGVDVKENYYVKDFALWLAVKSYEAFEQNEDNYTVWWVKDGFQYNLDELHQYWLENIKDK